MKIRRVSLVFSAVAVFWSVAQGDEQFVQADVYDALYQAYVECDSDFRQSRSEFITEKLERDAGQVTIESLNKIFTYNIEVASEEIAKRTPERETLVAQIIGPQDRSEDTTEERSERDKETHQMIREIDALLKEKRQYVKIHECVLEAL